MLEVGDPVGAADFRDGEDVAVGAAGQQVVAGAAVEMVGAAAGRQRVVADAAIERIGAVAAGHDVVAAES